MRYMIYSLNTLIMLCILSCSSSKVYKESGITNLTQLTTDKSIEVDPCITQDGTKIIFASDRGGGVEIWMMPISASGGIQQITVSSKSEDRAPDYSDSTNEIVFQSTRVTGNWNIWKISLGNRGLTQLTNNEHGSFYPKWSPDFKKIAFTAIDKNGDPYIWVMGSNGENPTQLGPGAFPDWSPDGKKILYSSWTDTDNADVWVMNFDGTEQIQITQEKEKQELYPVWSKDAKRIAYVVQYDKGNFYRPSQRKTSASQDFKSEIWICEAFGRNPTQLTSFQGLNISPCWSPDGIIAFVSSRGDSWDIWTMIPISN